ncbi:MAG: aminopeptidase P family protein [Alphaproteobacteria bacterium]|nr:aminopeptidase P family protein [Alphaproteobacteria bacterium]
MALHFEISEFEQRKAAAVGKLSERGLDGLLMFQQESMYYLTGYDTFGFCFFQCLYLGADGTLALLTRAPDYLQAKNTSLLEDIRIWKDEGGAQPATQLREMLDDLGCKGKKLGIEYDSYGLTAKNGKAVDAAMDGFAELQDASGLLDRIRVVKSEAELVYVRKSGSLADEALEAGLKLTRAGADEGEILAAMQGAVLAGGGDYPGNEFIIGSGPDALLCRYKSGRRKLDASDQLTLEWAGSYRHYHAAMMRTVIIGTPSPQHEKMLAACCDALSAVEGALKPGNTAGDVFDAHAAAMDSHGMRDHRMNACGYSLGAKFTPSWMDWPMFYTANDAELGTGMVFFTHMILMDAGSGNAMCPGRTYIIGDDGPECISSLPVEMICR